MYKNKLLIGNCFRKITQRLSKYPNHLLMRNFAATRHSLLIKERYPQASQNRLQVVEVWRTEIQNVLFKKHTAEHAFLLDDPDPVFRNPSVPAVKICTCDAKVSALLAVWPRIVNTYPKEDVEKGFEVVMSLARGF
jgi:hypothetical protein